MYTHDFIELHNPDTGHSMVAQEHTDELFFQGYRFVRYVPNSQVDFPEQYANDTGYRRTYIWREYVSSASRNMVI